MAARGRADMATANETTLALPGDREIVITRTFNGPPRIVFEAWTRPDLVRRWWAPRSRGASMAACEADVRVGGSYRYVVKLERGGQFAFTGRYIEVAPPSRLVYTEVFEPTAGGAKPDDPAVVVTVTFEEQDGRTFMTSRSLCPSKDVRDAIIASGMEHGMRETMDALDALVASLA